MLAGLLKFLAVFAFGMISFPFVLTNDALAFENINPLRITAYYAALAVVFAFGYCMGQLGKRGKALRVLCRFIGVCSFFFSLLLLFFTDSIMMIFTVGTCAVFWYFLGERATRKNYADFFPMFAFGIYIVITLVCYLYYGGLSSDELRAPVQSAVVTSFMAQFCLTALLVNQSGIYDKASRRRETKTMLPKGLSGYNAALVLVITLAGLGLYLFSDKIIWLITETFRLIIIGIVWLIHFDAESMEIQNGEAQEIDFEIDQELGGWAPITYILATVLLIVFRKQIWNAIKNAVKAIYGFFVRKQEKSSGIPEFVDILEQTEPRRRTRREELSDGALKRKYRAEAEPRMKYRLGYRILLRGMKRNRAKILPSDTAAQQCAKGRKAYGERLDGIAECYNAVRYNGEKPTAAQLAEIDGLIGESV